MSTKDEKTFKCIIADLVTEISDVPILKDWCFEYLVENCDSVDIIVKEDSFKKERYLRLSEEDINYIEAGFIFNGRLLYHSGFYLHASAVELDGKAFLFSADCCTGKSTHTRNWQKYFGEKARVFNDDKPALRKIDGVWYAYGTPWCGKDHININMKVPLAGICFLKQAPHNKIRRLTPFEATQKIFSQSFYKFKRTEHLDLMLGLVNDIVSTIPVFELENLPDEEAVKLSYTTMLNAAKEAGL